MPKPHRPNPAVRCCVLPAFALFCLAFIGCVSQRPAYQTDPAVQKQMIDEITMRLRAEQGPNYSIGDALSRMSRPVREPSDPVERAIREHEYEKAIALLDQMEDTAELTYGRAMQRAFAADQAYHQFNERVHEPGTWLKRQFHEPIRQKAERASTAYEAAYRLAPDNASRLRTAGQWQWLMLSNHFFSDSELLRSAWPKAEVEHTAVTARPEQTTARYREIERAVRWTLRSVNDFEHWQPEEIDHVATLLANEYWKLADLPVSAKRFEQIVAGIPDVLTYSMSLGRRESAPRVSDKRDITYSKTFRWHLWCGLTCELPSGPMREQIDHQIGVALSRWYAVYDTLEPHDRLPLTADQVVGWALDDYNRFKDNPLVPYYKRPYRPEQWARIEAELEEHAEKIPGWYASGKNRVDEILEFYVKTGPEPLERELRAGIENQRFYSGISSTSIIEKLRQPSSAGYPQMPTQRIGGRSGNGNNPHGVYLRSIGQLRPIPAFPWEKPKLN